MIAHAGCLKTREDLDKCSDDIEALPHFNHLSKVDEIHPRIYAKARVMWLYLTTGCWDGGGYPRDGAIKETKRICKAWHLSLNGRGGDVLALFNGVVYDEI